MLAIVTFVAAMAAVALAQTPVKPCAMPQQWCVRLTMVSAAFGMAGKERGGFGAHVFFFVVYL